MRQRTQLETGWHTSQAAVALLAALGRGDETALAGAVGQARAIGRTPDVDAWTAEKAELLDAVAGAVEQGADPRACYLLLRHLAAAAGSAGRLM